MTTIEELTRDARELRVNIAQARREYRALLDLAHEYDFDVSLLLGCEDDFISIEAMWVTPAMAEKWLLSNEGNRQLRHGAIRGYGADMANGRWRLTHQAIAFDKTGRLIDGQHRLHAVIRHGKPMMMMVAYGCDPKSFDVIDTHRGRTAGDRLGQAKVANPSRVGAIARVMLAYGHKRNSDVTPREAHEYATRNLEIIADFTDLAKSHTAPVAGALAFAKLQDIDHVDAAAYRLRSMDFLPDDPMKRLAQQIQDWRGGPGGGRQRQLFEWTMSALRRNAMNTRSARAS